MLTVHKEGAQAAGGEPPGEILCADGSGARWVDLVGRIRAAKADNQSDGMAELYRLFSRGTRFYLLRQIGPQELDDKVHDIFLVVVQAIRRGELRDPSRLMAFVHTIVRREVASHIDRAVRRRRDQIELDAGAHLSDAGGDPETITMFREKKRLLHRVLSEIPAHDREILTRFYLEEQSPEQICTGMALSETQFRVLKSRAKARFGELGRKKLTRKNLWAVFLRTSEGV